MKVTRRLPVKLNDSELAKLGHDMAETMLKIAGLEEEKKSAAAKFKGDIELLEECSRKLRDSLSSGEAEREVDCEEEKDFSRGEVLVTRLDTMEVYSRRTMTAEEREMDLFDKGVKKEGKLITIDGGKKDEPVEVRSTSPAAMGEARVDGDAGDDGAGGDAEPEAEAASADDEAERATTTTGDERLAF